MVHGIYVDNFSTGVTVRNNTAAFVDGSCYFVNSSRIGNKFINNTAFGGENELCLNSADVARNWEITGNIFASANPSASHRIIVSKTKPYTPVEIGTFTKNYVASPFSQTVVDYTAEINNSIVRQVVSPYGWESLNPQINGIFAAPMVYATGTNPDEVVKFYYTKRQKTRPLRCQPVPLSIPGIRPIAVILRYYPSPQLFFSEPARVAAPHRLPAMTPPP